MAEENFEDRRSVPRISVVCPVLLKGAAKQYQGLMRNISLYGAAIEVSEELPDKKQYVLDFVLPDGPELKATCEIIEPMGSEAYLYLNTGKNQLIAKVGGHDKPAINSDMDLVFDMSKVHFFDKETDRTIA